MRRLARVAGIAFSALVNVVPATAQSLSTVQAQTATAESGIDLVVVDVQGAVCSGAEVEILSDGRRVGNVLSTDHQGALHVGHLPPGTYVLKVSLPGFEHYARTVTLKSGVRFEVNVTLRVAAVQGEAITVVLDPIQVIQSETPLISPVPVPDWKPTHPGFWRRWFGRSDRKSNVTL
jgi:hypothetical protein